MLAAWMLYTVLVSLLLGLAGLAVERALVALERPIRWVWVLALPLALILSAAPLVLSGGGPGAVQEEWAVAPVEGGMSVSPVPLSVSIPSDGVLDRVGRPLAWAWGGGVVVLLGWISLASLRLRRRERAWSGTRIGDSPVLVSADVGPALLGIFRNRVVLPRWCLELPAEAVELVVAHEEEHRRAGDTRLVVPLGLAAVLLPWNLPFWWMFRRLREAVEVDCDRRVLHRFPGRRRLYGELLLLVCSRRSAASGALATFSEHRSTLGRRIRMLSRIADTAPVRRAVILSVVGGLLIVVACLVPGPDRDVPGLTEPTEVEATSQLPAVGQQPTFTPYEVEPEIRNVREVQQALQEEYPAVLRDAGIGGVVLVWFLIDEEGEVRNVVVNESSGHQALDAAAERVAHRFRFSPALNRDQPVPVWVQIPIRFQTAEGEPAPQRVPLRSGEERTGAAPPPPPTHGSVSESEPHFTPYEVQPRVANAREVQETMMREYPSVLRDAGIGGVVQVLFHVRSDGTTANAVVSETSGFQALDEAALRVAREFRWEPAENRGEAVPVWIQVPLSFQVHDD